MAKEFKSKLKFYHIILISLVLSPLLIINSNSINKKRERKEDEIILRKLYLRQLDFIKDTKNVCEKGSDDLKEYYETGDLKKLDIKEEDEVKRDNKEKYIDSLINLIAVKGDSGENIVEYVMHLIPVLIFFAISILFLPGWLVCCICCCADCCCCCCCKKQGCKKPFFFVTFIIYALSLIICIYGLSQSDPVFTGIADTECSILKFIGEVIEGETKEAKPKWIGISGIQGIFDEAKEQINSLELSVDFTGNKNIVNDKKKEFENDLVDRSNKVNKNPDYEETLSGSTYKLDIVHLFGEFRLKADGSYESSTPDTLMNWWYTEYEETAKTADEFMEKVKINYEELSGSNKDKAIKSLEDGENNVGNIRESFDEIKNQISGPIIDYSDIIDEYGKLGFKLVFSILFVFDAAIAVFISFQFFCTFQACQQGFFKCLFKFLIHFLWNLLALLTFFTLLIGSIFTLVGTAGKDFISVFEFLVSEENLNSNETVLIGKDQSYLTKCINGDGNITADLNLNLDSVSNIDELNLAIGKMDEATKKFSELLEGKFALKKYREFLDERINYKSENFNLYVEGDKTNGFNFKDQLTKIHNKVPEDTWSVNCNEDKKCWDERPSGNNDEFCINPKTCKDKSLNKYVLKWYETREDDTLKESAKIADAFIHSILSLQEDNDLNGVQYALASLEGNYENFLKAEENSLDFFKNKIVGLTSIFTSIIGDGDITSLLNCKFIGKNVRVILKTLEKALGKNVNSVGISLLIAGIAMCFSISFTILLNIIINIQDPIVTGQTPNVNTDQANFNENAYNGNNGYNGYDNNPQIIPYQ